MEKKYPAYLETRSTGELAKKIRDARQMLKECRMCPRGCGADRTKGEEGVCRTGELARVCSFNPHFGEEAPLVGENGSGTIFFSYCSLLCCFCQNYEISFKGDGVEVTPGELAAMMLNLQDSGCHNINLVTPTHVVPQILSAIDIAAEKGLVLPIVYNSGGYDRLETLELLNGVVDIYMPDFKFWDPEVAKLACNAKDYPEVARNAIVEMHRQVGDLVMDREGIALRGLLVRHLVMPDNLAGTRDIMKFIAEKVSRNTYVNVMSQYCPCGEAFAYKGFARPVTAEEYAAARRETLEAGLLRLDR